MTAGSQHLGGHRRVVVGLDEGRPGSGVVGVTDELMPVSVDTPRVRISDTWLTVDGREFVDQPPSGAFELVPPPHGVTWRMVEFKPGATAQTRTDGMHDTPTVDFGVVVRGVVELVLEDGSTVQLGAGDSVVLRGAQHTWANTGEEPCLMSIVLVRSR